MTIDVVIVNYRTGPLVVDTLASLAPEARDHPGLRVVVADNASPDDSLAVIRDAVTARGWASWVTVHATGRNAGFGAGNNAGARAAAQARGESADLVWFLNPDTLVKPGCVAEILAFMSAHPRVGVLGTRLLNADERTIDWSAHREPSPLGELEWAANLGPVSRLLANAAMSSPPPATPAACDWVSGASMIVRRQTLADTHGFDEGFFLYFEEVDLCRRARNGGWEVWFAPSPTVVHLEGQSTGITETRRRRPAFWYQSRRRYFTKHRGVMGLVFADICWAAGRTLNVCKRILRRPADTRDPLNLTSDLLLGDLRAILLGRSLHAPPP
jgi:N-acetylglucosaminyl-diphospho-decaprenol L-rhamnosyltransferase